ncbi:unnamed protein product, partial [Adineta steineri]
ATVGCPPTLSCVPLLKTICLKLDGAVAAIFPNTPICIITAPSPSKQNTYKKAIPKAIDDAWPIPPTVKKSRSCPSPRCFRSSNRTVFCLDGDGAVIMHMGVLGNIAATAPSNFKHIVFNNGT